MQNAKKNNEMADFARKESEYRDKIAEYIEKFDILSEENNILKQEIARLNKSKTLTKTNNKE